VEQGVLTISGQTVAEEERKERNYFMREHRAGRFSRSLRLPATYNTENCTASFEHGVLRLVSPKSERPSRAASRSAMAHSRLSQAGSDNPACLRHRPSAGAQHSRGGPDFTGLLCFCVCQGGASARAPGPVVSGGAAEARILLCDGRREAGQPMRASTKRALRAAGWVLQTDA